MSWMVVEKLAKIRIYLTPYVFNELLFDSPQFVHNRIFLKITLIKACTLHFHASFGTFCVQTDQLFEAK